MNTRVLTWTAAAVVLAVACNSNNGGSAGAGGQGGAGGGRGGQTTAAGGTNAATDGKGGQAGSVAGTSGGSTATTGQGGQTGGSAGRSGGSGGAPSQGGATAPQPDGAVGGRGGTSGETSSTGGSDAGFGGAGGSSGTDAGTGAAGDASARDAAEVGHPRRVLLVDEGNTRVHLVDLQNYAGTSIWTKQFTTFRDIQLVGGDRLAVSIQEGYVELDVNTGATKKEFKGLGGVESLRRLPNGNTVFGGNSDGGITLQELDSQDKPVPGHKITFTGPSYGPLRLLRRTPQGTFLIGFGSEDNELAEVNWDKQILWRMALPNAKHTYQGLRLPDGTIAVAAGYAAAIYVVDPVAKKVLATLGGKSQPEAATINPNFYGGFQVLANGHFVVTNWQNHGAGHGNEGTQLLEYDPSGQLVWKWKQDPNLVSSLHGVMVLDGFDTTKLHDDVNGVLGPVTQ